MREPMVNLQTFNPRRIDRARLAANMSNADLAYAIRRVTDDRLKPSEQSIRRWTQGKHAPREGVVAAIAAATGQEIAFFYQADDDEEDSRAMKLHRLRCALAAGGHDDLVADLEALATGAAL